MGQSTENRKLAEQEHLLIPLDKGGDIRVVLAYPNRYWLAMSNLGFQTVYQMFSRVPRFAVERAYMPEDDTPGRPPIKTPIKTFESNALLSSADILGISVSFETDYPHVLRMLESAGTFLDACWETRERGRQNEQGPLLIGGGAALTINPEPLANFFDLIVIGEGEEVIGEISDCYLEAREGKKGKDQLLLRLSEIQGVYVPSLFKMHYGSAGSFEGCAAQGGSPKQVRRRVVKNLDDFPTHTIIETPNTEFRSMFLTETGRGCPTGCKFCVAGYMYRPVRKRSRDVVWESCLSGLKRCPSVGFVGAAVSIHPQISELTKEVAKQGKRAALSSVMSQAVDEELVSSLSESEYKSIAIAPEAGSETLRFRIGKRVCDEQIVQAVELLAQRGISTIKLYFMVGLPAESREDVEAIGVLTSRLQRVALAAARKQEQFSIAPALSLSVNAFIPKPWTPFQRHCFLGLDELKARLQIVKKAVQGISNVQLKSESPRESYFQTLLSRGDRRVGDLLLLMHQKGYDWRWLIRERKKEILPGIPAADEYVLRTLSEHEALPWEVMDFGIKRSLLEREYHRTFEQDPSPIIAKARENLQNKGASC